MNELALFAGAGGGILGGHLLGWRTVCAVEIDSYAASVLCARQNDGILPPFPIWDDVCTFDGRPWRGFVDVVSGGFPCQDISVAGKGEGIDGERSGLWREMHRIIGEVRPRLAYIENSPALITRGLQRVLCDLAALGYDAQWGVVSAADVGAPHLRERIWIVCHANDNGQSAAEVCGSIGAGGYCCASGAVEARELARPDLQCAYVADANRMRELQQGRGEQKQRGWSGDSSEAMADAKSERRRQERQLPEGLMEEEFCRELFAGCSSEVSNANGQRREEFNATAITGKARQPTGRIDPRGGITWWDAEPDVGRVANGVAARVDRLRAIGNGQVPAVAATAFRILSGIA